MQDQPEYNPSLQPGSGQKGHHQASATIITLGEMSEIGKSCSGQASGIMVLK